MLEMDLIKEKFLSATSGSIGFRLLSRVDCYPLLDACTNEEFNKNLAWDAVHEPALLMPKIDTLIREMTLGKSISFSVVEKVTGAWIGIAKWTPYKDSYMSTTWAHPNYWGKKLPGEYLFLGHALMFQATQKEYLYAIVKNGNLKILKLLDKMQACEVGRVLYQHESGDELDCIELKIFNENMKNFKFMSPLIML